MRRVRLFAGPAFGARIRLALVSPSPRLDAMTYWIASLALVGFGFVAILSIGQPFAMVGLAMLILGPVRRRPALFWPPLAAVIAYNLGFLAVAPFFCTATASVSGGAVGGASFTTCSSLIGIKYSGTGGYNPSLEPAQQFGLALAGIAFVLVLAAMLLRSRRRRSGPEA